MRNFHVLAIVAHPDDESFLMAGTTMKFAKEGRPVGIICATRGEKGADRLGRQLNSEQMAQIRTEELHAACSLLGCDCSDQWDYPDGGLDQVNFEELTDRVRKKIDAYQPEIILTFGPEGVTGHKDHITIGHAAIQAAKAANHKVKETWLSSIPHSLIEMFNDHLSRRKVHHSHFHKEKLHGVPDNRLTKIDITQFASEKTQALQAHQSQYLPEFALQMFLEAEYFEVISLA